MNRVTYLVGYHHSPEQIDGIDYQILSEADDIVNASESGYSQQAIRSFMEHTMKNSGRYSTDENSVWSITEKFAAKREKRFHKRVT